MNKWVASVTGVIHVIYSIGFVVGKEAIKTYFPFLRLPVISQIFDLFIGRFGSKIDALLQLEATFIVVDIQDDSQRDSYNKAKEELKNSQGDQDALNKAREEFKKRLRDLVRNNSK